jgi:hypothetical protein
MKALGDIVLTAEQVAAAPDEVQRWLRSLFGGDERLNSGFILERNSFASSGDGLAISDAAEIERLLRALDNDFIACQVLFQLGCDFYNPQTGEHRGHVIEITDFINHTDVNDAAQLHCCLDVINIKLRELRGDRDATIYHRDGHGGVHVHARTQQTIYQVWRLLLNLPSRHQTHASPESAESEPSVHSPDESV